MTQVSLRPYQKQCVQAILDAAKQGITKQIIVMATGTGKTTTFGQFPSMVKKSGKKTLILAHREELLTQAKERIELIDPSLKVGIEQGENIVEGDEDVIISSVPTLGREGSKRIEKFNPNDFGLVIIDECHHASSNSYLNILRYFDVLKGHVRTPNGRVLLGVTATPSRADHQGLDKIFDKITFTYPIRQAIDEGYLSNIKAFTVKTSADLSAVHVRAGDFSEDELADAVNTSERNQLVVQSYKEIADNTKALVFACNIEHAESLEVDFALAGYKVRSIFGHTPTEQRKQFLDSYKNGDLQILVNVGVLTEGVDIPAVETILMARPTKSSVLFSQMVGRGLRLFAGKEHLNLIDFEDNLGRNSVMSLPSLFGVPKSLKGLKGRFVTEVADKAKKILEVYDEYPVEKIEDWSDENIEKIITEVDVFKQVELPEVIKQNSRFAWQKYLDGYHIQLPAEDGMRTNITIQPNMLEKYEIQVETCKEVTPEYSNGYVKWAKIDTTSIGQYSDIQQAIQAGDTWLTSNKSSFSGMLDQSASWRKDSPSEKQLAMLKRLGVLIPKEGLTKGVAAALIGQALNKRK